MLLHVPVSAASPLVMGSYSSSPSAFGIFKTLCQHSDYREA
jgi:hypothetical protein